MPSTYDQLWNELLIHLPQLPALLAQKLINRAWRDIRDHRHWSFLMSEGWLYSPPSLSAGTANVTQFSQSVTLDATASAALAGLPNPAITLRQFRVSSGPIYSITAADFAVPTAVVLTLDRIYVESTNATAAYTITRIFYGPPLNAVGVEVTDFLRYRRVYDPVSAYSLVLNVAAEELDNSDPQRASSGQPYVLATRRSDSNNQPVYEMWPSPNFERGYLVVYQKRGVDLVSGDSLPPSISDELVITRSLFLGCEWAAKQIDVRYRGINWPLFMQQHDVRYRELLRLCEIQDEEQMIQNLLIPESSGSLYPIDSAFLQSHAPIQ
jgi:hypothetical protein